MITARLFSELFLSDVYLQIQLCATLNPVNKLLFIRLVRLNVLLRTISSSIHFFFPSILFYIHFIQEINVKQHVMSVRYFYCFSKVKGYEKAK